MRTLAITQNVTLDGVLELLGDWFDRQDDSDDVLEESNRQDEHCDAVLLGRRTFEDFRGYWPDRPDDTTGISEERRVHPDSL